MNTVTGALMQSRAKTGRATNLKRQAQARPTHADVAWCGDQLQLKHSIVMEQLVVMCLANQLSG